MFNSLNYDKIYELVNEFVITPQHVMDDVFVKNINTQSLFQQKSFKRLNSSISKQNLYHKALKLRDIINSLNNDEKIAFAKISFLQFTVDLSIYKKYEEAIFNPLKLSLINDNLFDIAPEHLYIAPKYESNLDFPNNHSKYISLLIKDLGFIHEPKSFINSENYIYSDFHSNLKYVLTILDNQSLITNFENQNSSFFVAKNSIHDLVDFLLDKTNDKKILFTEKLFITIYQNFFKEASIDDKTDLALKFELLIQSNINTDKIFFLPSIFQAIDYYECSLTTDAVKVTDLVKNNLFGDIFIDDNNTFSINLDLLAKLYTFSFFESTLESFGVQSLRKKILSNNNKDIHLLPNDKNKVNYFINYNSDYYKLNQVLSHTFKNGVLRDVFNTYCIKHLGEQDIDKKFYSITQKLMCELSGYENIIDSKILFINTHLTSLKYPHINGTFDIKSNSYIFNKKENPSIDLKSIFNAIIFNEHLTENDFNINFESFISALVMNTDVPKKSKSIKVNKF